MESYPLLMNINRGQYGQFVWSERGHTKEKTIIFRIANWQYHYLANNEIWHNISNLSDVSINEYV